MNTVYDLLKNFNDVNIIFTRIDNNNIKERVFIGNSSNLLALQSHEYNLAEIEFFNYLLVNVEFYHETMDNKVYLEFFIN